MSLPFTLSNLDFFCFPLALHGNVWLVHGHLGVHVTCLRTRGLLLAEGWRRFSVQNRAAHSPFSGPLAFLSRLMHNVVNTGEEAADLC